MPNDRKPNSKSLAKMMSRQIPDWFTPACRGCKVTCSLAERRLELALCAGELISRAAGSPEAAAALESALAIIRGKIAVVAVAMGQIQYACEHRAGNQLPHVTEPQPAELVPSHPCGSLLAGCLAEVMQQVDAYEPPASQDT